MSEQGVPQAETYRRALEIALMSLQDPSQDAEVRTKAKWTVENALMNDTVTITLDPVEKEALRHETSEPYGHEVRTRLFEKLRTALDTPDREQGERQ